MGDKTIRIGLISDTHGLLRPEAARALRASDHIIHAGDICDPAILQSLGEIAPVTAVRGNNDRGTWADRLPAIATLRIERVDILVVHDLATLAPRERASGVQVIVCGHSHRPTIETRAGVLYVNPGSAGPRRFHLPIAIGRLSIKNGRVRAQLEELSVNPPAQSARRPTGADKQSSRPSRLKGGACVRAPRR